jgi:anti-sigma regulatory factor (Ser/Thr protein kinase)/serine/threonine protein phosphatase PrpC
MVVSEPATSLEVIDPSRPGEVRRLAVQLADRLGFNETERGNVAIVATELANNLVRHAKGGEILLQGIANGHGGTLEIVSLDRGPGIENIEQSLQDGYSTGGTSGTGLGAVKRLSSSFDLHSTLGLGSVVVARLRHKSARDQRAARFEVGAVSLCYPGEVVCGDAWAASEQADMLTIMVADGLGHGPLAGSASQEALRILADHAQESPQEILLLANTALRTTRGAAVAIAQINTSRGELNYAGLGNIAAMIVDHGGSKNLVSLNGIVGAAQRKIQSFTYPWSPLSTLVMFSDGLTSHLRLDKYFGLLACDPTVVAGVLYRDFKRGRDDATVVVIREGKDLPV